MGGGDNLFAKAKGFPDVVIFKNTFGPCFVGTGFSSLRIQIVSNRCKDSGLTPVNKCGGEGIPRRDYF